MRKEKETKSSLEKKDRRGKAGFLCGKKEVKREKERRKFFLRESAEIGKQEKSRKEGLLLGQFVGF